jgi:hypothetical protein
MATHSLDLESSSSQYASIADASAPNLEISGSQTFEAWIKPESFADFRVIMAKANSSNVHDFYMGANAKPVFRLAGLSTNTTVTYTGTLIAGVWVHVAGVYDSTATKLRLYINGELDNEVTASGSAVDTNGNFYIGANDAGTYFDGLIRNVRVWNVARTQQEIRDNMNIDTPVGTGLQGNWILNNAYTDSSGNGYTLTPSGSPVFSTTYPDAIDLVENKTFTKKHKITVQHTQVAGNANLTDVPIVFTENNFLSEIFTNSQGSEINTNKLKTDSNLKAYYRFESGALTTDSSSNGYTLTNNNTVAEGTGKFGGGADQGTSNTTKSFSILDSLGVAGTSSLSISFWIKLNTEITTGTQTVCTHLSNTGADRYFECYYDYNGGNIRLRLDPSNNGTTTAIVNGALGTTAWHHIVLIRDVTAGTSRIWVNNVPGATQANGTTGGGNTNKFSIGANPAGSGETSAIFDDLAVFNRALSAEEVRSLYAGGQDLRFSSDIDGKTRLAHEIVSFDKGTSKAEVWVKANTLDFDDNTDIYVHYGNATASALDENEAFGKHQVYVSNYKASYKLLNTIDSTSNSRDLTNTNSVVFTTGKTGLAADLGTTNVTNKKLEVSSNLGITTGNITMFCWGYIAARTASYKDPFMALASGTIEYRLHITNTGVVASRHIGLVSFEETTEFATNLDTWYFLTLTYNTATSTLSLYVDGQLKHTKNTSGTGSTIGNYFAVGNSSQGNNLRGKVDSAFVYSGLLTADEIQTLYNNQNNPATFAIPQSTAGGAFLLQFV